MDLNRLYLRTDIIASGHIQNPVKHLRGSFLQKYLTVFTRYLFFAESSVLDVWLGSEYDSKLNLQKRFEQ